jgi:hypothetical protein
MAEEKVALQEFSPRTLPPWTEIFRGFQIAMDPKKLLLAAAGIVIMYAGWWILGWVFYDLPGYKKPDEGAYDIRKYTNKGDPEDVAKRKARAEYQVDLNKYNLMYEAANTRDGTLRTPFWSEKRGPNPYLLVTNQVKAPAGTGQGAWFELSPASLKRLKEEGVPDDVVTKLNPMVDKRFTTEEAFLEQLGQPLTAEEVDKYKAKLFKEAARGEYVSPEGEYVGRRKERFTSWFAEGQFLVAIEPLVKFLRPLVYLVDQRAGFWQELYFLLVMVWTVFTWSVFGSAITRMAAVQLARKDRVGMVEALRFVWARIVSYFTAPLIPLVFIAVCVVGLFIFGLIHMIPWFGDVVWSGLLWPLVILAGILMAVVLIGLVGWPLMCATISTEGSDNFDALSRSYSYIYQSPWHFLWYSVLAVVYGAVLIFFVGFVSSLAVYLGKWGVGQGVLAEKRNPSNLFVYAPESYHWRDQLLQDAKIDGQDVVVNGEIDTVRYNRLLGNDPAYTGDDILSPLNKLGAVLVGFWVTLFFLLVIGFGYSYFWCASTIIYLLMRRRVDDTEFDEVYLEEEEPEDTYSPETPTAPPPQAPSGPPVTMVESPTLRPSPPPAPPPPMAPPEPAPSAADVAGAVVVRHPSAPEPAAPPAEPQSSPVGGDQNPPAGQGAS